MVSICCPVYAPLIGQELVGNALIMDGEKERDQDLRFEELSGVGEAGESENNEEGE